MRTIRRIFSRFYHDSDANIPFRLAELREKLEEYYVPKEYLEREMRKREEELAERCGKLQAKRDRGSGSKSPNVRINGENVKRLASDELQVCSPYYRAKGKGEADSGNVGLFLKTLLEDYAERPYLDRERIYFHDMIRTIQSAVKEKRQLKVVLYPADHAVGKTFFMKPFCLDVNRERRYRYLAGYVQAYSPENGNGAWRMCSFRLAEIESCEQIDRSGALEPKQEETVARKIREMGIEYLQDRETVKVVVKFTRAGERLYKRILELRPLYESRTEEEQGETTCTFRCPRYQARVYFYRFGGDARILEPADLADEFRTLYREAAERYNNRSANEKQ